ncbi:unnamed protein product, partial [Mesorhabditis spiculigera]
MMLQTPSEISLTPRVPTNDEILHRLPATPENVGRVMHSDATTFWPQMQQIGLLDEIVDTMLSELDTIRNETRVHNITPRVCATLSRLCSSLDLTPIVAAKLRSRPPPPPPPPQPMFQALPTSDLVSGERKRSLDEALLSRQLGAAGMMPELKKPRAQYPQMVQSPLIEALLKVQTTYQMHQTPFANMDLLLKFASQPPAMNMGDAAGLPIASLFMV